MNCIVYNNKCIIDVSLRVCIISGHVTDNIHSTVQMPVTRHTGLAVSSAKILIYFLRTKYTEATLSNSTRRKPSRFKITKMLITV